MSSFTVTELGQIIIDSIGIDRALEAYDLWLSGDVAYWVGRSALAYGDIDAKGQLR